MSIELYKLYVARTLRPFQFDAVTPDQLEIPSAGSIPATNPRGVNQNAPRNVFFVQYDESTHVGIAYVCSSLNHEPDDKLHRWVAIAPTQTKYNPSPTTVITHSPKHSQHSVFINFAFKYKIRVHESIPSGDISFGVYQVGTILDDPSPLPHKVRATPCRIPPQSIELLEELHRWFWLERKTDAENSLVFSVPTRANGEDFKPKHGQDGNDGYGSGDSDSDRNVESKDVRDGSRVGTFESVTCNKLDDFGTKSPTDEDFLNVLHTRLSNQIGGPWSSARRSRGTRPPSVCSEDWTDDSEESETEEVEGTDSNELKERTKQLEKWVQMSPIDVVIVQ
ncbi:hypothetical protein HDU85_005648 [Gaertneriomyces sp. JEL0708]|nr:hypothetical protein HDU85_005648 [Gaertneriomyces sp. JEL0708]